MNPPLAFRFAVLRSASAVLMSCSLRELSLGLNASLSCSLRELSLGLDASLSCSLRELSLVLTLRCLALCERCPYVLLTT